MSHTPHGADALAILSGQASSFSPFVRSVSLTNLLWLLLPLFLCLRALLLSAQGKTECPCQESGTLSYSRAGSSHCVQYPNQHFCASVFWHSSENTVVIVLCANTNTILLCLLLFYTLNISYLKKSLND